MEDKIGFLYPGFGVQKKGMGYDLYKDSNEVKHLYQNASNILGYDISEISFFSPNQELENIKYAQPAIVAQNIALTILVNKMGIYPTAIAGLSLGQLTGLYASKMLSCEETILLTKKYSELISKSDKGVLFVAYMVPKEVLLDIIRTIKGKVWLVSENSYDSLVFGGLITDAFQVKNKLNDMGYQLIVQLPNTPPAHTPLTNNLQAPFKRILTSLEWSESKIPLYSDVTGEILIKDKVVNSLLYQLSNTTHFIKSIQNMYNDGIRYYVCFGPNTTIQMFVKNVLKNKNVEIINLQDISDLKLLSINSNSC